MYFKEYLRARNCLVMYTIVWAAIFGVTTLISVWLPAMGVDVNASHGGGGAKHAVTVSQVAWPALLGVAAFLAAIVSTVLGSTLSQENDGHLEFALTKPFSRVTYASTSIVVDLAAVVAAELIGFAFIMLHYLIFHRTTAQLVAGPDPFLSAIRLTLFPLAWYAIIAGLSAGTRGKAGIVQGLIWPLTFLLAVLRDIPPVGMWVGWHNLFVALNVINPLMYTSYQDRVSDTTITLVGPIEYPGLVSAMMLLLFIVVGWGAALLQWRRVEA